MFERTPSAPASTASLLSKLLPLQEAVFERAPYSTVSLIAGVSYVHPYTSSIRCASCLFKSLCFICPLIRTATLGAEKKDGGNLVTEFAGEGWDDLLKQLIDKV